jgi:hypothetical protein
LALAGALGVVAVIGPLAVRLPQKANAADSLLDTLNVTPEIAAHTRDLLDGARAATEQMEDELYPDVAADGRMTAEEFEAELTEAFPALAPGALEDVFARYERRVRIRESGLTIVPEAKKFPLQAVTWWSVVPGAITAVACAAAITARRRQGGS